MNQNEPTQTDDKPQPKLLTVRQVAGILGVTPQSVRTYIKNGLPAVRLSSHQLRVDTRDLDRWIEHRRRVA